MKLLRSSGVLFIVFLLGVLVFVTFPRPTPVSKEVHSLTGMAKALADLGDACEIRYAEFARELNVEWTGNEADRYCFCFAAEILLPLDTEEKALQTVSALVGNKEVFDAFLRMESIVESCIPEED